MAHPIPADLETLRAFSARIGADPLLTQAAGGNTSLKDGDTLWIKASGTWLAHALERDIMVPVRTAPLIAAVDRGAPEAEQAERFTIPEANPSGLRPSIETTVHALVPQRVVAHVHCVDTIALAIRDDAQAILAKKLAGLNWAFVPYRRPGLPLAMAVAEHRRQRPDVLVLGNHGLVVTGDTVEAAEALLMRLKSLLRQDARPSPGADLLRLGQRAGDRYRLPDDPATHAVATDPRNVAIASGGSLYPDHVVFLGVGSILARDGEDAETIAAREASAPMMILFPGQGVLLHRDATPGAEAMARCLADVATRVEPGARLRYLSAAENHELLNWDAEKYRQSLAERAVGSGGAQ